MCKMKWSTAGNANSLRFSALMEPFSPNRNLISEFFSPIFIFSQIKKKSNEKNGHRFYLTTFETMNKFSSLFWLQCRDWHWHVPWDFPTQTDLSFKWITKNINGIHGKVRNSDCSSNNSKWIIKNIDGIHQKIQKLLIL